jgi:hypothetical protein
MGKAPAFQFYAKDWLGSYWIAYDFDGPWDFQPIPGVYVVYLDGQVAYVGQSTNVQKRICSYNFRYGYTTAIFTPWGQSHGLKVKVQYSRKYGDWAMKELRLIKRLQPPMNCVGSIKKRTNGKKS